MSELSAGQLIYANVRNAADSPRRLLGEQTVFYTHPEAAARSGHPELGLTPEDATEIEERLFYKPPAGRPVKRVFFRTRTGKAVLGRVVGLAETDEHGRGGLCFGHALAFAPDAFRDLLHNDPFLVFDSRPIPFQARLADVQAGDRDSGDIAPLLVRVDPPGRRGRWPDGAPQSPQLRTLLVLAARGRRLAEELGFSVGFFGGEEEVYRLLCELFLLLPLPVRPECSFDTLAAGSVAGQLPCWGVGLPAGKECPASVYQFDLDAERFARDYPCDPERPFERWLAAVVPVWPLPAVGRQATAAHAVGSFLEWLEATPSREEAPPLPEGDGAAVFRQYVTLYTDMIEARVVPDVLRRIGAELAGHVTPRFREWMRDPANAGAVFEVLQDGVWCLPLAEWLVDHYGGRRPEPVGRKEMRALRAFCTRAAERTEEPGGRVLRLRLMLARFERNWKELTALLEDAGPDEFEWFLGWALDRRALKPHRCLHYYEHGVAAGLLVLCSNDETVSLLNALLGLSPELTAPAGQTPKMDPRAPWKRRTLSNADLSSAARFPLLVHALTLRLHEDLDALQELRDGSRDERILRQLLDLKKAQNWKQLQVELRGQKEHVTRAFTAALAQELTLPLEWSILHLETVQGPGSVFFGPFIRYEKEAHRGPVLGLVHALLDAPVAGEPAGELRPANGLGFWRWVRSKVWDVAAPALPIPHDVPLRPGAGGRWPALVTHLVPPAERAAQEPRQPSGPR